jgi:two-component system chemotaxis sensor kinase CheA
VSDTIRISTAKLDTLLLQVEEMLSAKLTTGQRASDLRTVTHEFNLWRKAWTKIYPETQKVRRWLDRENHHQEHTQFGALLNFLEWNYTRLDALAGRLGELTLAAEQDQRTVGGMVDNLLEDMKTALMMPFASMLEIFPKMARDLARTQGKQVDLILRGSEVEIDRRILEEMKDPLIHLIRNAIDHGLEPPTERAPKPERGTILLTISQLEGSKIEILLEDDGAGINLDALKATAVRQGVLSKQEAAALDEREAIALIFRSAISTSPIITDISGRGLGMAIVQEKVEKLGGTIAVTTRHGAGTTFRILLPVTMAVFRGVLVRAAGRVFVIPTLSVKRVVRVKPQQIKTVQNEQTIVLNDYTLSIVPLDQLLELPPLNGNENGPTHKSDFMSVVVLQGAGREIAFIVDEVLNEQEVLVKGLGKQLSRVRNVAGATILGSGQVIPILNVSDLIKSAVNFKRAPARTLTAPEETAAVKSILVVEDSITSRTLLKNVLEVAGYQVKTCVDGVDAWTTLRSEPFDLMVSDVEMPRMNGFDLVAQVRADQKLAHLPVVLVTSLSSKEDRERGVDVGADAYIVKSSFDQTSLLETIRRLI